MLRGAALAQPPQVRNAVVEMAEAWAAVAPVEQLFEEAVEVGGLVDPGASSRVGRSDGALAMRAHEFAPLYSGTSRVCTALAWKAPCCITYAFEC